MGSARRLCVVASRLVGMLARDELSLGEPLWPERGDVYTVRAALGDELRHATTDGGSDLEAGPAEGRGEIEPVDPRCRAQDRVTIGTVAVERAIAARELRALHAPESLREELSAFARCRRRKSGAHRVGIDVPYLARHTGDREDVALRPE